ncbi:membrane protein [Arenimonas oryziterrae]|uniref:DNA gyrase subunit B n=1 Tax=Arenimonas oryziterrae DSM 21050 = YC6267 TaxID=1121015 RepID=A0A091BF13_9GAMM|nr:membrane protein [Arenimonas oryziterrae]KFN42935.1 hypothetical protein N789_12490 [Arenimonas oryziterrae DSM 21050 = YC6267]
MRLRTALIWLVTLLYPLAIYFGLGHVEPRWLAIFLLVMATARAVISRDRLWLAAAAGAGVLVLFSVLGNDAMPLKLYPVLVNAVMLVVFAVSLRHPPTVIERLARLQEPDLPPEGVVYTRKVTIVWCGFFVLNGSIALITALWCSDAVWALYNGLLAYVLMGVLFAGEWLVRRRVKAGQAHG